MFGLGKILRGLQLLEFLYKRFYFSQDTEYIYGSIAALQQRIQRF